MRKTTAKVMVAVMLSSSVVTLIPSVNPTAVYAEQVISTNLSKPISIENYGTIELKTIFAVPSPEGQVVSFTLDVVNTSKTMIDFNKYWLRLDTGDSKRYSMHWVDQSKNLIYPGQRQTLFFYTVLPNSVKMSDLKLRLVKWDSSVASFERNLGELPINADIVPTLGRSLNKYIGLTNNQVEARVELGSIIEDDKQKSVSYNVHMINKGQYTFSVPTYEYILVTNTGIAYPLSAEGSSNQLLPWIEQEVSLTGTVPSSVDLNDVALYILYPHGGDKGNVLLPVTVFRTFDKVEDEGIGTDGSIQWGAYTEFILKGEKGEESTAKFTVTSVQRFPWDHRDLLSAQVKIINTGTKKVAIPKLKGQFVLGSGFVVNADVVLNNEEQTFLYPGNSVTFQVMGLISYASSFNEAYIELKESDESGYQKVIKSGRIPRIAFTERDTNIKTIAADKSYVLGEGSSLSTLKFHDAGSYTSTNGKYVVSRVVITNLENRGISVPSLKAYYRTKEGIIYPATTSEFAANNFPRGSSVISFWAEFPEDIKQDELQLIIGEEVNEKGLKDGVSYKLNEDTSKVIDRIDTIEYYPYTLKFSNFFAEESQGFRFKITKEKAFNSIANLSNRKLIMEFTNVYGDVLAREEVIVEGANAWNGDVRLNIPSDPRGFGNNLFTVTIYDEYDGSKKALAKQSFYVYSTTP